MPEVVRQGVLIEGLLPRPAVVEFDGHQHTSDLVALLPEPSRASAVAITVTRETRRTAHTPSPWI